MFEEEGSTSVDQLFADDDVLSDSMEESSEEPQEEEQAIEETEESTDGEESSEESDTESDQSEEGSENSDGDTEEESSDTSPVLATIEIDGKEFELDESKIQSIAENYVKVAQENRVLKQNSEQVQAYATHIENIRNGVDIDESMQALGVDWDSLITDKVKDFIRRSTLSKKERELEDERMERQKLQKKLTEREEREKEEREKAEGQAQATALIQTVNTAISKVPEKYRKEIQIEVFGAIERRLRQGGNHPSAKAINNAVNTIYNRKYKAIDEKSKANVTTNKISPPKNVKNNPTPSTGKKRSSYNATDYNDLFK